MAQVHMRKSGEFGSLLSSFLLFIGAFVLSFILMGGVPSSFAATTEAEDLCNEMAANVQTHETAAITRVHEAWRQNIEADQVNPQKDIRGNIKKKQCIGVIFTFMDTLRNLLSGISLIKQAIMALIKSLLNQVCSFVATAINNVLASVCLPIPSFSFSASLPSISSKSCNGLSLLSVFQAQSNTWNTSSAYSVPALNASTVLSYPLRRGTTLKNGATE